MKSDIEITQEAKLKPIEEIAGQCGLADAEVESYGHFKAKIKLDVLKRFQNKPDGKLILVTTMSPTPQGVGKTTVTIGLGQALKKIGKKSIICLREPSLGPVMGLKGGAAGGGYSQVLPMEDINLHFTGDSHMVASAHNLLAALIDNHFYFGNSLKLLPERIIWHRTVDLNDRALRQIQVGLGDPKLVSRFDGFEITAASEVMAILCLSHDLMDLKERLKKIIVGFDENENPVTAGQLKAAGAMTLLLKEAIKPNLVQSIEGVPALIHGGPFANIAHGCNSILATRMGLKLADFVVTEAGFGADLGAEKFFDIKCRIGSLKPAAAVCVVSVKALAYQSGAGTDLGGRSFSEKLRALKPGFENLAKQLENIRFFGVPAVIAINRHPDDEAQLLQAIQTECEKLGPPCFIINVHGQGGEGAANLAEELVRLTREVSSDFKFLYPLELSLREKIEKIALTIYGAFSVEFSDEAYQDLDKIDQMGFSNLPICMAKTQFSLSDDPKKLGRPVDFKITVKRSRASAGAGFIVVYTGDILTMPGLPQNPAAERIDVLPDGKIIGLF
jgi:formate--tetrahydrofolate ligase